MVNITNSIPDPVRETLNFLDEEIVFELNHYAYKADAAITVQKGETVLLATVTVGHEDIGANFMPLSVEYIEKYYAGGIISSSRFVKRETRPSEDAVLKARQVDHAIRSLFPKYWRKPVSVVLTVLAYDGKNDPEQLAVLAASSALMMSSIPFDGPSMSIKLGIDKEGEFIWGPTESQEEDLQLDMVFSVLGDRILNIEGWADEVPEGTMIQAMQEAVDKSQVALDFQKMLADKYGNEKIAYEDKPAPTDMIDKVKADYADGIAYALSHKDEREGKMNEMKAELAEKLEAELPEDSEEEVDTSAIEEAFEYVARRIMREMVLTKEERTSGRRLDEIRPLKIEVGVLPRVHGSSVFTRGMTQSLTVLTLGSTRMAQTLESFEGEDIKRFMHHYSSPNYSYGDAGRFSYYPGRREIGHGNIGENGLRKMIPNEDDFPYTIRVNSEIMSSNGSTSMAATCAATLALADGGVPLKNYVAGVALGLVTDDEDLSNYKILVDMEDVEDFYGDMDFKVTGTDRGVTAIQMDNKLKGVPVDILADAFQISKKARLEILEGMKNVIADSRETVGKHAPKVKTIKIKQDQIGDLIGPGGKHIRSIVEKLDDKVEIDIQEDGTVYLLSRDAELQAKAEKMIDGMFGNLDVGEIYDATIDKIAEYGVFVEIQDTSVSGLVHVSELSDDYVKDPNTLYKVGDQVKVKLLGYDDQNRPQLSIKQAK